MTLNITQYTLEIVMKLGELFDNHGIDWWTDAGTLLCGYRDGTLAATNDVDLGVWHEDFPDIEKLLPELDVLLNGCRHYDDYPFDMHFNFGNIMGHVDLGSCYTVSSIRLPFTIPKRFHQARGEFTIKNVTFKTPTPIEEYLEWYYGIIWYIPMTGHHYMEYQKRVDLHGATPHAVNRPNPVVTKWREENQVGARFRSIRDANYIEHGVLHDTPK